MDKELIEKSKNIVNREVLWCASTLVNDLLSESEYSDELLEICTQTTITAIVSRDDEEIARFVNSENEAQEFVDDHDEDLYIDYEEETVEALEFWLVTDWLAKRLKEYGEMVKEFKGLNIWGRITSGQSIYMDNVIFNIAKD